MPTTDPLSTSTSLLNGVRCGDQQAWFRFVETYAPLVELWCRQHHIRAADAEDVVQNVFSVVARHVEDFGSSQSENSFRGWLWTITHSKIIDHLRLARRQPTTFENYGLFDSPTAARSPDAGASADSANDLQVRVESALVVIRQDFSEQTWEAFWLTAALGWPPRDVAERLGMTAAAVCMSRGRVMRRLRETLQIP